MIFTLAYDMSYLQPLQLMQHCSLQDTVKSSVLENMRDAPGPVELERVFTCAHPPTPPCHGTGSKITLNTGPNIPAMVTTGTSIYTTVLVYTHTWNQTYFSPCLKQAVGKRHIKHTGDGQYVWFVVEEASHTVGQVDIMVADA